MQQHNAALTQASNFCVRACGLLFFFSLSSLAAAALRYVATGIFKAEKKKKKNVSPFNFRGVTVWWDFGLSVPPSLSEAAASSDFSHGGSPQTLTFCFHLLPPQPRHILPPLPHPPLLGAGGLARRQAAPLSLSPPSQLTRCQLGCSSPCGLRHGNGRREVYPLPASVGKSPPVPTYIMSHRLRQSGREAKYCKVDGMSAR